MRYRQGSVAATGTGLTMLLYTLPSGGWREQNGMVHR